MERVGGDPSKRQRRVISSGTASFSSTLNSGIERRSVYYSA